MKNLRSLLGQPSRGPSQWAALAGLASLASWSIRIAMLFVIPRNRKPSSATAWLMLTSLFPFAGLPIFLLIGSPKLPARRRAQQRIMDGLIAATVQSVQHRPNLATIYDPPIPPRYAPFVRLNTNLSALPAFRGNAVELISDYDEAFQRIAEEIERAQVYVHLEYFALSWDRETDVVFTALERARRRGVQVRILLDHLGSRRYPTFKETRTRLSKAGIEWHLTLPFRLGRGQFSRPDLRNHRKIVVVDGAVGFTGSQNLIQRNYFRKDAIYYDELVARVSGPVVAQLHAAFLTDWYSETGIHLAQTYPEMQMPPPAVGEALCQVLPSGPGFENENNLKLFTELIHAAQHRLVIGNPYFVPEDALLTAITSAAQRGVDVTLINSEATDQFLVCQAQRSYYEELLGAGVKLYWYPAPILLHSKFMAIDEDIAVIGSSNLDIRSFQLNLEVTLLAYDTAVVADLHRVATTYIHKSKPVTLDEWQTRPIASRLAENVSRLTAALE